MTVVFDGAGFEAERICAKQFGGVITDDMSLQYKDIDLFIQAKDGTWKSCSVKDQLYSTKRGYSTIQIELQMMDTTTRETMLGCYYSNESDYYFWRVWWSGADVWCVVKAEELKSYIEINKDNLHKWNTTNATNEKNKSYGRKYNSSSGVLVNIETLTELGVLIPVRK